MRKQIMAMLAACTLLAGSAALSSAQNPTRAAKVESGLVDAVALFDNGKYKEAASLLKALSVADPSNDAVCYYLGMCSFYLGSYDDAAAQLRQAVRLDPENNVYRAGALAAAVAHQKAQKLPGKMKKAFRQLVKK